jgi:hypothetical protein
VFCVCGCCCVRLNVSPLFVYSQRLGDAIIGMNKKVEETSSPALKVCALCVCVCVVCVFCVCVVVCVVCCLLCVCVL